MNAQKNCFLSWDKFAATSSKKLVVRAEVRDVLPHVVAEAHGLCRVYPVLAPMSHSCQQAANGAGATFCSVDTLMDESAFVVSMTSYTWGTAWKSNATPLPAALAKAMGLRQNRSQGKN